jgi:hypothetical protein
MRQEVIQRVEQQFGVLPKSIEEKVQAVDSLDPLAEMLTRLSVVQSADELVSGG